MYNKEKLKLKIATKLLVRLALWGVFWLSRKNIEYQLILVILGKIHEESFEARANHGILRDYQYEGWLDNRSRESSDPDSDICEALSFDKAARSRILRSLFWFVHDLNHCGGWNELFHISLRIYLHIASKVYRKWGPLWDTLIIWSMRKMFVCLCVRYPVTFWARSRYCCDASQILRLVSVLKISFCIRVGAVYCWIIIHWIVCGNYGLLLLIILFSLEVNIALSAVEDKLLFTEIL